MGRKGLWASRLLAGFTLATAGGLLAAALGGATHAPGRTSTASSTGSTSGGVSRGHTPVTLCHATGSRTNPYVRITVDDDGVLGSPAGAGNGHDGHARDIIPPFAYTDNSVNARTYPGKNWDAEGRAIFENGCRPVTPPPTTPPPTTTTTTPTTTTTTTSTTPTTTTTSSPPTTTTAATPASPLIDIVVTKVDTPDPVQVGTRLAYTITVTNKGPDPATNVLLTDPLTGTVVLLAVTPSQGTCASGSILTCALGTIQAGQVVTVMVLVRPTATGRIENTATAVGSQPEANPSDNTATAVTVVYGPTKPPRSPKPPSRPTPPKACISYRVAPLVIRAGRVTAVRVVVTERRRPAMGMRVVVRGVGVHATAVTGVRGIVVIRVRPRRTGFLTVTLPGRRTCAGPRRVGVVAPVLRPPITG